MSDDLSALADETAERLNQTDATDTAGARHSLAYASGVLRALAVALRPTPPPTRPRGFTVERHDLAGDQA